MRFASIGSGSEGNGTLICNGDEGCVLLDCGFSAREALRRMAGLGIAAADLAGILVTHEHSDHIKGVARLANQCRVPVYTTWGTYSCYLNGHLDEALLRLISPQQSFSLAGMCIEPVPVPHDAREPCQFVLATPQARLGILTDAGSVTPLMVTRYGDCDALMLECNHDLRMLAEGPYPAQLKRRVAGPVGHLNNQQAADLLNRIGHAGLQHLIVTHISQKNNAPDLAVQALLDTGRCDARVIRVAQQQTGLDWLTIRPRSATIRVSATQQLSLDFEPAIREASISESELLKM